MASFQVVSERWLVKGTLPWLIKWKWAWMSGEVDVCIRESECGCQRKLAWMSGKVTLVGQGEVRVVWSRGSEGEFQEKLAWMSGEGERDWLRGSKLRRSHLTDTVLRSCCYHSRI